MKRRHLILFAFTVSLILLLGLGSAYAQQDDRDRGGDSSSSGGGNDNSGGSSSSSGGSSSSSGGSSGGSSSSSGGDSSNSGGSSSSSGDGGSSSSSSDGGSADGSASNSDDSDNGGSTDNTNNTSQPTFVPPALPDEGCFVTPAIGSRVWARPGPSENQREHGHLLPGRVYEAVAMVEGEGGLWVELFDFERAAGAPGYVAGSVVLTSDCPVLSEDDVIVDGRIITGETLVFNLIFVGWFDPGNPDDSVEIELQDAIVSSYSVSGGGDDEPGLPGVTVFLDHASDSNAIPMDTMSLNFGNIQLTATEENGLGWLADESNPGVPIFYVLDATIASAGDFVPPVEGEPLVGGYDFEHGSLGRLVYQIENADDIGGINSLVFEIIGPQPASSGDGVVDGADYLVWRDNLGTPASAGDYNVWRENFGTSSSGIGGGGPHILIFTGVDTPNASGTPYLRFQLQDTRVTSTGSN